MRHRDNTDPAPAIREGAHLEVTTGLAALIGADAAVYLTRSQLHGIVHALQAAPQPGHDLLTNQLAEALRVDAALRRATEVA